MPARKAKATWLGDLKSGSGQMSIGGRFEQPFSFASRFENGNGSNPEELIGGALAGCFSMALSADLGRAGFAPKRVQSEADVWIEKVEAGFRITKIDLRTQAEVPGIDQAKFLQIAEGTKKACPVATALAAVTINLDARLG
jgi:osmotically inducible protein OsmC